MKMWQRLSLANGITIAAALIVFGAFLNYTAVSSLERELDRRAEAGALLVARQVDGLIQSIEYCGDSLVFITNETVSRIDQTRPLTLSEQTLLENQISFALSVFPHVSHGWIVLSNRQTVGFGRMRVAEEQIIRSAAQLIRPLSPMGPNELHTDPEDQIGDSVMILSKRLINIATGAALGTILLTLDRKSFEDVLARTDTDLSAAYSLVDAQGEVLADLLSSPREDTSPAGQYSEFDVPMERVSWKVLSRISQREIAAQTRRNTMIYILVLSIAALTTSVAGLLISRSVTHPLSSLETQMKELDIEQGTGTITLEGTWEIQQVAEGANKLLERVHTLVDRVSKEERERQRYRFELLQAQIKPHFLYNALEMIHVLGETGRQYKAQRALRALSEFYRLSLSSGKELISLKTELELTEHYLFIQHMRYHDQFRYVIECSDKSIDRISVPKLTIQPLVENAIYHGIKGLDRVCTLLVRVETAREGTEWCLTVSDTGRGMDENQRRILQSQQQGKSVGVPNVLQRLSYHSKGAIKVSIDSALDKGTTILIRTQSFPLQEN